MLSQAQIDEFRERGYLKCGKVYSDEEADRLRERMMAVREGRSAAQPELNRNLAGEQGVGIVTQIVNIWQADDLFRQHIYHPAICEMAADLMGDSLVRVWHDQIQYKPPHEGGKTGWHQDHPAWPIIQPADLVSAWVALDDATPENGCMRMVPGSHKWGAVTGGNGHLRTNDADFTPVCPPDFLPPGAKVEIVACPVKKGEVMFHHCLTWHGSPPNRTDRGRPAIAVHYMPGYTRYEPVGSHVMGHRVTVAPGEILQGEYFPTVWDNGPVAME